MLLPGDESWFNRGAEMIGTASIGSFVAVFQVHISRQDGDKSQGTVLQLIPTVTQKSDCTCCFLGVN